MSRYSVDDAAERLEELIDQVLAGELVEVVSASGFVATLRPYADTADDVAAETP
jgi:antitoxin (DNA-binding transcriptional repressor) of toxin-antitoxin stability system